MIDHAQADVSVVLAKTPGIQYLVLDAHATVYEYTAGWADLPARLPPT